MPRSLARRFPILLTAWLAGCAGSTPTATAPHGTTATAHPEATATPAVSATGTPSPTHSAASALPTATPAAPTASPTAAASPPAGTVTGVVRFAGQPVAGAGLAVRFEDGSPVLDGNAKPLVATTDATGRYGLSASAGGHGLVLAATLPGNKGTLTAIAPPAATQTLDLDEASTVESAWILKHAVAPQPIDGQVTLDKLTAAIASTTRDKVVATLKPADLPATLDADAASGVMDVLRQRAADLATQLDAVQQALAYTPPTYMAAGVSAAAVAPVYLSGLAVAPDDSLYFNDTGKLWRLANGQVQVAGGGGSYDEALNTRVAPAVAGQKAIGAYFSTQAGLSFDAAGRLLVASDAGRTLDRVETDGTLTRLVTWGEWGSGVQTAVAGTHGETWVVRSNPGADSSYRLFAFGADDVERPGAFFFDQTLFGQVDAYGTDGKGTTYMLVGDTHRAVYKLPPGSDRWTRVTDDGAGPIALDGSGNVFRLAGGALSLTPPDGTAKTLWSGVPSDFTLGPCAATRDGGAYVCNGFKKLLRIKDGAATPAVGVGVAGGTGDALTVGVDQPKAVTFRSDGTLLVADDARHQLLKVNGTGTLDVVAGTGQAGAAGGTASTMQLNTLLGVQEADGNLWLLVTDAASPPYRAASLRKIAADGTVTDVVTISGILDASFAVATDGTVAVAGHMGATNVLYLVDAGGHTSLQSLPAGKALRGIRRDPRGGFIAWGLDSASTPLQTWVGRWSHDAGLAVTFEKPEATVYGIASVAVDAQGRLYTLPFDDAKGKSIVKRYDPADGSYVGVAGDGTPHLNGTTSDGSLVSPNDIAIGPDGAVAIADIQSGLIKRLKAGSL